MSEDARIYDRKFTQSSPSMPEALPCSPFFEATISEVMNAFSKKEITCEQLVSYYLKRIAVYDPIVNAMLSVDPDLLAQARAKDRDGFDRRMPLWGIPLVLKDNIATSGMPTSNGARALKEVRPADDAVLVKQLKAAGAIIVGKTNLSEFACSGMTCSSLGGQTLNPYDLTRTPGGSSGGTGAAVACNFAMAGLGTDAVNSVRSPASATSLVGLRPTKGLICGDGVATSSHTQDTPGILARTVADAACLLDVLALPEHHRPKNYAVAAASDVKGRAVGVLTENIGQNQQIQNVIRQAIDTMESLGIRVVYVDHFMDATMFLRELNVVRYEQKACMDAYLSAPENRMPVHSLKEYLDLGMTDPSVLQPLTAAQAIEDYRNDPAYRQRLRNIALQKAAARKVMDELRLDAFFYPTQTEPVAMVNDSEQRGRTGILASALGFPAITVPGGFTAVTSTARLGIPVGVEWMARPFDEEALLSLAGAFERKSHYRCPPVGFSQWV